MSKSDLLKDILRLKLQIGEEVIGKLPEGIREHVAEKRREMLQAVQEAFTEFLAEKDAETREKADLKQVAIE